MKAGIEANTRIDITQSCFHALYHFYHTSVRITGGSSCIMTTFVLYNGPLLWGFVKNKKSYSYLSS